MRAFCYPSGLIDFGNAVPKGAEVIARGPEKALRDFITVKARHVKRGAGLLVPGVPEADNQIAARRALDAWTKWIGINPPCGVRVLPRQQAGEAA